MKPKEGCELEKHSIVCNGHLCGMFHEKNLNEFRDEVLTKFLGLNPSRFKSINKVRPLLNKSVILEMQDKFYNEGISKAENILLHAQVPEHIEMINGCDWMESIIKKLKEAKK